jgi:hypothetical protein
MTYDTSQKVNAGHLTRDAYLYVRQSTPRQVLENTESTKRQYALRQRATALGWAADQIHVIDCDMGHSASETDREVFQQLVTAVGLGRAGLVLGLEVSRLARNSIEWHRLLELCALTDTLILDEDGIYDPAQFNDRLLLGLNRPDSYSTSYSTFHGLVNLRSISKGRRFRVNGASGDAVASADVSHMLSGKGAAEGRAPSRGVQLCRDLGVRLGAGQGMDPVDGFGRRFQRIGTRLVPWHREP